MKFTPEDVAEFQAIENDIAEAREKIQKSEEKKYELLRRIGWIRDSLEKNNPAYALQLAFNTRIRNCECFKCREKFSFLGNVDSELCSSCYEKQNGEKSMMLIVE